jgi:hypothetical protein
MAATDRNRPKGWREERFYSVFDKSYASTRRGVRISRQVDDRAGTENRDGADDIWTRVL